MSLVELFEVHRELTSDEENLQTALDTLRLKMNAFIIQTTDIKVLQTTGPYFSHLPPGKEGEDPRFIYTASILYEINPQTERRFADE